MTASTDSEHLERQLVSDLARLGPERLRDEKFGAELYRALANNVWSRDGTEGEMALSWRLAERIVNDLRAAIGYPPLALAQTGGEGEVSHTVDAELRRLGWRHRPLDTGHHEDDHVSEERESPPPPEAALKHAPLGAQSEQERFHRAHEEAEVNRQL
jgi:hypothetical protein